MSFIICSCNKNISEVNQNIDDIKEDIPFIIDCAMSQHKSKSGTDSKIGVFTCDGIEFTYDLGSYSYSGPTTVTDEFRKKFYAYYYSQFFDVIKLDERLRESFKDSVDIIEVVWGLTENHPNIISCENCNATATLKFKNKMMNFPFLSSNNMTEANEYYQYIVYTEIDSQYFRKTFLSKDNSHPSGIYVSKIGNPRKNRNMPNLSVVTDHFDTKAQIILESVRLK